jgi:hypothetical protein
MPSHGPKGDPHGKKMKPVKEKEKKEKPRRGK